MDAETDDLAPLMRAIDAYQQGGVGMHTNDSAWMMHRRAQREIIRRKAEQYGAWQRRKVYTTCAPEGAFAFASEQEQEARDAYFAD